MTVKLVTNAMIGLHAPCPRHWRVQAVSRPQKEYGIPQPPYRKAPNKSGNSSHPQEPSKSQSRRTWDYGAPASYTSPPGYGAPKQYKSPAAYGPGQSSGGGDAGGSGGRGWGGGGGGDGSSGWGLPRVVAFLFAVLVAVGGFMGYRKKGSTASLKASGGIAVALLLAGLLIGGQYNAAGLGLALAANLALGGYMVKGYVNTRKVFPQAVFSLISGFNSLLYIKALTQT